MEGGKASVFSFPPPPWATSYANFDSARTISQFPNEEGLSALYVVVIHIIVTNSSSYDATEATLGLCFALSWLANCGPRTGDDPVLGVTWTDAINKKNIEDPPLSKKH